MTDGQDPFRPKPDDSAGQSVASLASQALALLASKQTGKRALLSERLIARLADAAIDPGEGAVRSAVTDLRHSGIPPEEIVDFYIPEAARRLGEAWVADGLGFAAVTIGSVRLQQALRGLCVRGSGTSDLSALVTLVRGETHTLGALVIADQLRREGVSVRVLFGETPETVQRTVASGQFDAVFLSAAMTTNLADVRNLVERVRVASGGSVPVAVGGAIGYAQIDVGKETGADHAVTDVREAIRLCGLSGKTTPAARALTET